MLIAVLADSGVITSRWWALKVDIGSGRLQGRFKLLGRVIFDAISNVNLPAFEFFKGYNTNLYCANLFFLSLDILAIAPGFCSFHRCIQLKKLCSK